MMIMYCSFFWFPSACVSPLSFLLSVFLILLLLLSTPLFVSLCRCVSVHSCRHDLLHGVPGAEHGMVDKEAETSAM